MSARQHFSRRRAELQLQCAAQRAAFVLHADEIQSSFDDMQHGLNRGLSLVRGARVVPMLLSAFSAAGALSRASGVARLIGRAWMIWQTVQRLRRSMR
jgi:YqjK-like protein